MESLDFWNAEAANFDSAADHGLRDPQVRESWRRLLTRLLPKRSRVLDVGCGTGSLSLLMAEAGHVVTGIDFAPAMIEQAKAKASQAGHDITFAIADAADPDFDAGSFDVVLGRHILWAIPEKPPRFVMERWSCLLVPAGYLVMIEGFWHTGAGLKQDQILAALPNSVEFVQAQDLAADASLWGAPITDERYVIVARRT